MWNPEGIIVEVHVNVARGYFILSLTVSSEITEE